MHRTAKCLCGDIQIKVQGEPKLSLVCNCTSCQRRTGSAFGTAAYYSKSAVIEQKGICKRFSGIADSGNKLTSFFCSECGTTVYWEAEKFQGLLGFSVGCFTDPNFPEPTFSVWNDSKLNWVQHPDHWLMMNKQEVNKT